MVPPPTRTKALPHLIRPTLQSDDAKDQTALRKSSRSKLKPSDLKHLKHYPPLFQQTASALAHSRVLPRKELFETWETALRVDRKFYTSNHFTDLAAGHGLLGFLLVLLARQRGQLRSVVCVDIRRPASAMTIRDSLLDRWAAIRDQWHYVEGSIAAVTASPGSTVFVSIHACGPLSDAVIQRAVACRCPVAVMPCCHSLRKQPLLNLKGLTRSIMENVANDVGKTATIDATRAAALRSLGFNVTRQSICRRITPYNGLIMAATTSDMKNNFRYLTDETSGGKLRNLPQEIPVCDLKAVAALSVRVTSQSSRTIELSFWQGGEGCSPSASSLRFLALLAIHAAWRSPRPQDKNTQSRVEWNPENAAVYTMKGDVCDMNLSSMGSCEDNTGAMIRVHVSQREEYTAPDSKRACSYQVEFSSTDRVVTRGDISLWQSRMRDALRRIDAVDFILR